MNKQEKNWSHKFGVAYTKRNKNITLYRPKVSVLMSIYNGERYLKESIESIINQTFKDFELLIIDDGSSDDSRVKIDEFSHHPNI